MKKIFTPRIIVVIFFVLLVTFIYVVINKSSSNKSRYNQVTLSSNNLVIYSMKKFSTYDTILRIALDEYGVKDIIVSIQPLPKTLLTTGDDKLQTLAKVDLYEGIYYLFIDDLDFHQLITVVSHEVIHIKQYQSKRIEYDYNTGILKWEGKAIDLKTIPYDYRPWEVEAFQEEGDLRRKVEKILYQ